MASELVRLKHTDRLQALLTADDPAAAVAGLPFSEVFELVHGVGFEDAGELIALASPEQLRGCLDLDGWDKDQIDPGALLPWLEAVIEAGFEKVGSTWAGLDPEFRALWLQANTAIYDLTVEEDAPLDQKALYETPDRFYLIALLGDDRTQRITHSILEDLYRADPDLARHTILAARSEPSAELQEMAYRWRSGRLADIGYIDFYDALDLFKPLLLSEIAIGEGTQDPVLDVMPSALPATVNEEVFGRRFLAAVLATLSPTERERVEQAMMVLVNRVLAAGRAKPGQEQAVKRGAVYATATVTLGLETIARGDIERGAAALRSIAMLRLFRAGFTLTRRLAKLAMPLRAKTHDAGATPKALVAAVAAERPLFPRILDTPPRVGLRPFESVTDIRVIADVLTKTTVLVALCEALGVELGKLAQLPEPKPTLEHLVRTATVHAAVNGRWQVTPLTQTDLQRLRTLDDNAVVRASDLATASLAAAGTPLPASEVTVAVGAWLAEAQALVANVRDAHIDPRFIDGLVVARS